MPRKANFHKNKFNKVHNNSKVLRKNTNNPKFQNDKFKKFKHLRRNQETEEMLRRQQQVEQTQQQQQPKYSNDLEVSSEEEEANPMDQLIISFETQTSKKIPKNLSAIESSDSSDTDEESASEDEKMDENELKEGDSGTDEDEEVSSNSDIDAEDDAINSIDVGKNELNTKDQIEEYNDNDTEEELDDELESSKSSQLSTDIFSLHLSNELSPELLECVNSTNVSLKHELNWPKLGKLQIQIPTAKTTKNKETKKKTSLLLSSTETFATEGTIPKTLSNQTIDLTKVHVKNQINVHLKEANKNQLTNVENSQLFTDLQTEVFSIVNNYQDLYYPNRTIENGEEIRFTYCMHALNHILKTRAAILHHNAKIGQQKSDAKDQRTALLSDNYRDQGLFRPKILILVPFRDSALRVVNMLISLIFPERGEKVMNYNRFVEEYGGEQLHFPKRNPKPEDYEQTFAGNSDDTFRLGICITRKCMKLFTDFYSSDILIASPLGLRMVVGAPGDKDRDYDFLASIELLILDQADLFLAQNWDHLLHVMDHLHLQPQSARSTDFSRVRSWCLNGWTKFYRQTLLFTTHELPEFRSFFNSRFANYRGKVRVANPVTAGTIRHVAVQLAQVFHRVDVTSLQSSFDQRFNHFVNIILPQYSGASMAHCLVFIPSYFDYVRIRNYFKKENTNFVQICEYTKDAKIARSRDMFFHSGAHYLIYSERAHFFRRTRIKGIRHLIFYQPPTWPNFYSEMINLMQEAYQNPRDGCAGSMTVTVLYTKYDMMQISSIIGSERASKLATSEKTTHMFMTEE